jgi:serine/threonine-protein kinase
LNPGALVGGRYRLVRRLGEGGIGVVWKAESALFGDVAVKILHAHLASDPSMVKRFAAEARAAATISHPNVVNILDLGQSDEAPFFVMEHCDGETLDITIDARGAVGVEYACELVSQVLSALDAAHALGIVHRDLKPGNIIVVHPRPDRPVVKVLDFGIATRVRSLDPSELGRVYGTPHYMAPEQIRGAEVDERVDIYAVGAILYELLTGRSPFPGRNPTEVMTSVMLRPPKPIRAYVRSLPASLESLVRRCLAKDPRARPATAADLEREVSAFAAPKRKHLPTPPPRVRKKSEPVPLVRRASPSSRPPFDPTQSFPPLTHSEPMPLVPKATPEGPPSVRRPVLELVNDSIPPDDET